MGHIETQVTVGDHPDHGRYEIHVDGELAGYVEYRLRGDRTDLVHTQVLPDFEGRGLGDKLARGTLDAAREEGLSVIATCPFIRGWLEQHPEFADVVAPT